MKTAAALLSLSLSLALLLCGNASAAPRDDILRSLDSAARAADPAFAGFSAARGQAPNLVPATAAEPPAQTAPAPSAQRPPEDPTQGKSKFLGKDLPALDIGSEVVSWDGKLWKITAATKEGITQENAKKVTKLIRDEGPKGVKAQIQGDELRISSKSRDDLQRVQALIKEQDYDFAVQFVNYR